MLLNALVRLGEDSDLRKTNPDVLKMENWEVINLGVIKPLGWLSGLSIWER